jgi:hypothetical protein
VGVGQLWISLYVITKRRTGMKLSDRIRRSKKIGDNVIFTGDDEDYLKIEKLGKKGTYAFASCCDISWGFILPCKSGVVWEQQTDGCCCHHVYIEGVLIPLGDICDITKFDKVKKGYTWLISELTTLNTHPPRNGYAQRIKKQWELIKKHSHIDFELIGPQYGIGNQEGFQWIKYHGHEEGHGNSFSINAWKDKPIVLVYPNSD